MATAAGLLGGLADPRFRALLQQIDGGPIHAGNRVELFFQGDEALGSMLEAIAAAEREVLVEAYIFEDDETGGKLLETLAVARGRSVEVRVLADAFGSLATRRAFWRRMASSGIEVRLFHPLLATPFWQLFRDHRKLVVVDRRIAFTGGMNISDEYGSSRRRKVGPWRDTHLRVAGPVAAELAAVFSEGWERAGGRTLRADRGQPSPRGDSDCLVLDSRPGRGHRETASALAAILGAARESVWITNAYFAPSRTGLEILASTGQRGVDVRLLLPGRTDVPLVRHAGHGSYSWLLRRGVRLFEYQPSVLHAKSLVADRSIAVVGSTNFDSRSFRFNAECNLAVLDEGPAGALADRFLADLESSVEIRKDPWRRRGRLHRLGDRLARGLSPLL